MSSQASACYDIKFSGKFRGFACVLFQMWQAIITPGLGASGCGESRQCEITDDRGQWSYRRAALWHPAREPRQLRCTLEIYSTSPRVREKMHWARPRPHAGSGWRHVKKLPTFYRHPWQNERTNLRHCHCLPFSIYGFVLHKSRMHPFMAWLWFHKCR